MQAHRISGWVRVAAATAAVAVGLFGVATAGASQEASRKRFAIRLSGAAEVPENVHGDADHGSVVLTLHQAAEEICWSFGELTLTAGETLPHMAHIHQAPVGEPGPIVVTLFGPPAGTTPAPTSYPTDTVCVAASFEIIKAIRKDPSAYYVNMHNMEHMSGAVRGQLG
jgi:hypothetical protein